MKSKTYVLEVLNLSGQTRFVVCDLEPVSNEIMDLRAGSVELKKHEAQRIYAVEAKLGYAENPMLALQGADALVIVTEWKEFRSPDFDAIKTKLKTPVIFDGRNLYDPKLVRAMGLEYHAIGR